jgi:hypothetical protein
MGDHTDFQGNGFAPRRWNNLDELRELALTQGCTPAQFSNAVETVGPEPHDVANYLQRRAFMAAPKSSISRTA